MGFRCKKFQADCTKFEPKCWFLAKSSARNHPIFLAIARNDPKKIKHTRNCTSFARNCHANRATPNQISCNLQEKMPLLFARNQKKFLGDLCAVHHHQKAHTHITQNPLLASTPLILHRFGRFQALITSSYYTWSYCIVGFGESGFVEATFEEKSLKNGHFSSHYCVLSRVFAIWLHPSIITLLSVPSYDVVYTVFMLQWKEGVLAKKIERQGELLFLSHHVPMSRKWPNLHGGYRFELPPNQVALFGNRNDCWCIWGSRWRANVARNVDDKSRSGASFSCRHETLVHIHQRWSLYSIPTW